MGTHSTCCIWEAMRLMRDASAAHMRERDAPGAHPDMKSEAQRWELSSSQCFHELLVTCILLHARVTHVSLMQRCT